jgi:crossover junction endodeoxyribonuclease RuvC
MLILGIDVGLATTGWSILKKDPTFKNGMDLVEYGVILTSSKLDLGKRLKMIYERVLELIKQYKPDVMAVESIFYFKNQKTIIDVSQVRGVLLLAAEVSNIPVFNYTPLQVKTAVTGYGRAEKKQVQSMIKVIFSLKEIPEPDDAADAIAVSVCHCNTYRNPK